MSENREGYTFGEAYILRTSSKSRYDSSVFEGLNQNNDLHKINYIIKVLKNDKEKGGMALHGSVQPVRKE